MMFAARLPLPRESFAASEQTSLCRADARAAGDGLPEPTSTTTSSRTIWLWRVRALILYVPGCSR